MAEREIGPLKLSAIFENEVFRKRMAEVLVDVQKGERAVGGAEKEFKKFFQAQRTGDRIQREGAQALSGVAQGLTLITGGYNNASVRTKAFNDGIFASVQGLQQAEFATFALSRSTGALGASMMAMAGPIMAVVAIGAGLLTFLASSRREAEALDKQIEEMERRRPGVDLAKVQGDLQAKLAAAKEAEEISKREANVGGSTRSFIAFFLDDLDDVKQKHLETLKIEQELHGVNQQILADTKERKDLGFDIVAYAKENAQKAKEEAAETAKKNKADLESALLRQQEQDAQDGKTWMQQQIALADQMGKTQIQREDELQKLKIGNISDDLQRELAAIEEKYRLEEVRLRALYADDARLQEVLSELAKQKARERGTVIANSSNQTLVKGKQLVGALQQGVGDLGVLFGDAADPLLADLQEAFSIVQSIMSLIEIVKTIGSIFSFLPGGRAGGPPIHGLVENPIAQRIILDVRVDQTQFGKALRYNVRNDIKRRMD